MFNLIKWSLTGDGVSRTRISKSREIKYSNPNASARSRAFMSHVSQWLKEHFRKEVKKQTDEKLSDSNFGKNIFLWCCRIDVCLEEGREGCIAINECLDDKETSRKKEVGRRLLRWRQESFFLTPRRTWKMLLEEDGVTDKKEGRRRETVNSSSSQIKKMPHRIWCCYCTIWVCKTNVRLTRGSLSIRDQKEGSSSMMTTTVYEKVNKISRY